MIERNYDTSASVYRLATITGNKREFSATATLTTKGILLPASVEDEALLEGGYSEVQKFLCPVVDIRKGDKVVIGSVNYLVGGLRNFNNSICKNKHLELVLYNPN